MAIVTVRDIRRVAEQESVRHFHYYVGVEHLFIAMTKIRHGVTSAVLNYVGIEPRFIRYMLRHEIGVNEDGRYWSGFRETPRATQVLETAQKYAGIHNATEQHLLMAILDEGDSAPIRVLEDHGCNIKEMRMVASNWSPKFQPEMPIVTIHVPQDGPPLSRDERLVLERMFRNHDQISVERELNGGYSGARLLVVAPRRMNRIEARVVVKIADRNSILHEQHHYEQFVKDTFPPTHARLMDTPSLPEESQLGGLKYSLVRPNDSTDPMNLQDYASRLTSAQLSQLLYDSVYGVYAEPLWQQRQRYRFGVWREYEHILPPAIEITLLDDQADADSLLIEPMDSWSREDQLRIGQVVRLKGFTVQKVNYRQGFMQLSAGIGPEAVNAVSKVLVIDMGKTVRRFRRGDIVDVLTGEIQRRRKDILRDYADSLSAPFDIDSRTIAGLSGLDDLPNPLRYVHDLLNRNVRGYLSLIHGDLHLGNILVGPAGDAWLIDFAMVREGHSLFDWALLEISLLCTLVAPVLEGRDWEGIWEALTFIRQINELNYHMSWQESDLVDRLRPIITVREIVHENLSQPDRWQEYHIALVMLALRGLSWVSTTSLEARRLLFGIAALSLAAIEDFDNGRVSTPSGPHGEIPTGSVQFDGGQGDLDFFDSEGD